MTRASTFLAAAALAIAAVLWSASPLPVGAVALWLGLFSAIACVRARRARRTPRFIATYALALVLIGIGATEAVLYATTPPESKLDVPDIIAPDETLGYAAVPGVRDRGTHRIGEEVVYSVEYTFDDERMRVAPPPADPPPTTSVLCFGCSYMYGTGVEDEEAVPYRLQDELDGRYRVYNLALGGWGAHQMLARLTSGQVEAIVDEPPLVAVYWALPDHVWRAAGERVWDREGPLYGVNDEGLAERLGTFADLPGAASKFAPRGELEKRSWILQRIAAHRKAARNRVPLPADVARWRAIVRTARAEVEARFPGCAFVVLFDDRRPDGAEEAMAALDEIGVTWKRVTEALPHEPEDPYRWRQHPRELHPTPEAASRVARYLADEVVRPVATSGER
ncbi:MAG: hypothetical protein AAF957_06805 [Planctomycetota bacterium]